MARIVRHSTINHEGLIKRLDLKGWTKIGNGAFGAALAKGSLVWKIENAHLGKNSPWAQYIQAVARGEFKGPHVPRVRLVLILANGSVAALMERLAETIRDHGQSTPTKARLEEAVHMSLNRRSRGLHRLAQGVRAFDTAPRQKVEVTVLSRFLVGLGITKSFLMFAKHLKAWAENQGHYLDVHGHNIMMRANGTLVVTDPVS